MWSLKLHIIKRDNERKTRIDLRQHGQPSPVVNPFSPKNVLRFMRTYNANICFCIAFVISHGEFFVENFLFWKIPSNPIHLWNHFNVFRLSFNVIRNWHWWTHKYRVKDWIGVGHTLDDDHYRSFSQRSEWLLIKNKNNINRVDRQQQQQQKKSTKT